MKTRLLPISIAIALSASLTTAGIVPVTAQAVAQSMSEKANPNFVYTGPLGLAGYQTFRLDGIPQGVMVSGVQVKGQFGYGSYSATPAVSLAISDSFGLTVSTGHRPASTDGTVGSNFDFIITYSDGSVSKFSQDVRFVPGVQADAFDPHFENRVFIAGETTERRLSSMPEEAKLSVVSAPEGWSASVVNGNLVAVTAPIEATTTFGFFGEPPQFEFSVIYPDGSAEIVAVSVVAVIAEKPKPTSVVAPTSEAKPTSVVAPTSKPAATNEKSSSTGAIIAAVLAVLAIVGAGAIMALNPQLRAMLPF